ncbi:IS481 family transposase [Blastococcus sp. PRF04-17]|nr:IS481 family transposase [Blastococcus sp. PRF04-17]UOY02467.1 IS481 family transposase [Blastococcus sp. PRF04-17]
MAHANARTTVYARKLIVARVLAGHRPGEVAKQLGISRQTVYKWVRRFRAEGRAGLADRSSRPHRMPRRISVAATAAIVAARRAHHAGPVRLAAILGVAASTIGAVLARAGMPRLADVDRLTGELLRGRRHSDRRYEHEHPGDLLHVDVKKLGRVPDGGGWRVHGRSEQVRGRGNGWDYVHVAIDDHTRLAYAEVLPDERAASCAGFLTRAVAWFAAHGVTIRRVLTDNALSYRRGDAWIAACTQHAIGRRFIKPGRPWTNGKAERFNRTLQTEWAYATAWTGNDQRTAALDSWLEHYNTARSHSALGGRPPVSRLAA